MIYKLQTGGIIKLQNAGSLPKWMQKLNSWSIPYSDESAGERILNSTIEQANDAATQEERDQIYKDSAKTNLITTGLSLVAPHAIKFASTPAGQRFITDTTASVIGGNLMDRISRKITGNPFGRWLASNFDATKTYDNSNIARFGFDSLNPGYWMGGFIKKAASLPFGGFNKFNITQNGYLDVPQVSNFGEKVPDQIKWKATGKPFSYGAFSNVYDNGNNVIKVSKQLFDVPGAKNFISKMNFKNTYPGFLKQNYLGYSAKAPNSAKLYFSQPKATTWNGKDDLFAFIAAERNMRNLGYRRWFLSDTWVDTNSGNALYDIAKRNIGTYNGKFTIFDAEIAPHKYKVIQNPAYIKPEINTNSSIIGSMFGSSINNK